MPLQNRCIHTTGSQSNAGPFQLMPRPRGHLDSLSPRPLRSAKMLASGQALLAVSAVGLNFRDVLNVLGMYPGDPGPPGENGWAGQNRDSLCTLLTGLLVARMFVL